MMNFELQDRSRWILSSIMFAICAIILNIGWTIPFLYGGLTALPVVKLVFPTILTFLAAFLFFLGVIIILPIIGETETDTENPE
ncbi:MAG: hypothetical protein ACFFDP_05375 [Promethearchaeota archaeon]